MARRVATTTQPSSPRGHRRSTLASAATMLPLAIGLAANVGAPKPSTTGPVTAGSTVNSRIAPSCSLPFEPIQRHHAIDDACPATGNSTPNTPQAAQNEEKNNFCSANTPNTPVNVDFDVLRKLQQEAAAVTTFGSDQSLPKNRAVLQKLSTTAGQIGEGTVVRIVAFVINAHPSNVGSGESVNCKRPDAESNDIHIVLGQNSNQDDECSSVTAEMSPHFRPDVWTPDNMNRNNARLFRFTGHLFFDGSHKPCTGATGPNPKRSSLFEIHPVYGVEICGDTKNDCKVDSDQNWISLADFVGSGAQENESVQ